MSRSKSISGACYPRQGEELTTTKLVGVGVAFLLATSIVASPFVTGAVMVLDKDWWDDAHECRRSGGFSEKPSKLSCAMSASSKWLFDGDDSEVGFFTPSSTKEALSISASWKSNTLTDAQKEKYAECIAEANETKDTYDGEEDFGIHYAKEGIKICVMQQFKSG